MNIKWNAEGYTKDFKFVHQYGEDVLALADIQKGQHVLDLGCGNGVLTKKIADLGAVVTGIDASEQMLAAARTAYPGLTFLQRDAADFTLDHKVDVVFSNAVFHWIDNQDGLLSSIADVLNPGGYLVCEFGGFGCCETIHTALQKAFEKRGLNYRRTFYFPTIGTYTPIVERHGLTVTYAVLFDRMTKLAGQDGMRDWIHMFVKAPFAGMEEEMAEQIISEAVTDLKNSLYQDNTWYADYVRIRVRAQK